MKKYSTTKPFSESKKAGFSPRVQKKLKQIEKQGQQAYDNVEISGDMELDLQNIKDIFVNCSDLIVKELELGEHKTRCFAAYLASLAKKEFINDIFLKPLMTDIRLTGSKDHCGGNIGVSALMASNIYAFHTDELDKFSDVINKLLAGYCILFIDGSKTVLSVDTVGNTGRNVSEPRIETVVKGPHEAFVEDARINFSLLRKRIRTPELKLEFLGAGRFNNKNIAVSYIKGIANDGTVKEVMGRIGRIDIDIILDSTYIEKLIEDSAFSPFPLVLGTERPDKCAAALTEGRVVIFVDGSPNALIVPVTLSDFLVAAEDYYYIFYFSTLIRLLRYMALAVSLLGPSLYIAVTTFHQEMIPLPLLITVTRSRADVPFPAILEALLMEFTFELLREAGIRLPQPVGPAVSIVGGLVIGQGVVQAGIVSQSMVIVVALTGIASFAIPSFNAAVSIRFLRFPIMLMAAFLGIYGIIMSILVLLIHLISLRSFGVPYLSPFTPLSLKDLKDSMILAPLWMLTTRPSFIQKNNPRRMKSGMNQDTGSKSGG